LREEEEATTANQENNVFLPPLTNCFLNCFSGMGLTSPSSSKKRDIRETKADTPPTVTPTSILTVTIVPDTWIIAPLVTKEQLQRWYEAGFIDEDGLHLDRAFPRNSLGQAILFRKWLRAPMIRACGQLRDIDFEKCRDIVNTFSIIDNTNLPVEYIVIPKPPLRYRRHIMPGKTEFFEYIDSTTPLTFRAVTKDPKTFLATLILAGRIGIMSRTKYGYGKFSISIREEPQ
jgi:hypothetical protein